MMISQMVPVFCYRLLFILRIICRCVLPNEAKGGRRPPRYLNASIHAMLAINNGLQEVKTVTLEKYMALDLLVVRGVTCKVIGVLLFYF